MTLGFSLVGRTLTISGLKDDPQNRLTLDGAPVDSADLSREGGRSLLKLPLQVFDARSHRLTVTPAGDKPESFSHASAYEGALTSAGDRITGWLRDTARPGCPIEIDVDIDGHTVDTVMCDMPGEEGEGPEGDCAFEFDNPVPPGETRLLGIRVRGTDYYPLGKHLIRLSPLAAAQALDRHLPAGEKRRALDAFNRHQLLSHARSGEAAAFPDRWAFTQPCHGDTISHGVDVIVPVYRGKAETLACIDSILKARGDTAYNLIVINDASPEPDLVKALKSHAVKHDYTLLHNAENLGFVATVNRGMALNDDNDVVLVNADTEVSDFWLDRLKAAAWSAPSIASATPLSNNATILSLPDRDGGDDLPYGLDLYHLNALAAREAGGVTVDLPTAHGFCMYIRREALRETGLFDAETFGKGYGEENDFCLRAAARGWRNIAACDVVVRHKGSVSFGANADRVAAAMVLLGELYPDYDGHVRHFMANDSLAAVRNRFQKAQWRDKPLAVFISLATGGGVDTNVNFLAKKLQGEGYRVVIARRSLEEDYAYTLAEWRSDDGKTPALLYPQKGGLAALCADILSLQPRFIHVHHLIDLEDGIDRFLVASGIPYYVTLHDYFYLCPRVTLLDDGGEYSEVPDFAACNTCLKRGGAHRDMNPSYDGVWPDIVRWRDKWHDLLKNAVALFAPSKAAAAIYERTFTGLPIQVRPHQGPAVPTLSHDKVAAPAKIKVALLGGVGKHKGYNEIIALLRWAEKREPDLSFALIGFSDDVPLIQSFPNLDYMGPYTPDTLETMVKDSGAQVALFMSPWPETYVYTLSEALTFGLTPVATDLGAPGERLRALKVGELVTPGAPHGDIVKAIRAAATTKITPHTYSEGAYASLARDYYGLDAIADDRRNHSLLLPGADGLHDDAWATRDVTLRFAAAQPVNRLKLDFYIPESFGPQQAAVRINDEDYGRISLPADGSARRLDIATRPVSGLVTVELNFSFTHRLAPPDERMGAAKLGAASFEHSDDRPAEQRPAPAAVRLRPSPDLKPDLMIGDLPALEDGSTLEDIYRGVTSAALTRQTPGLLGQARRLARDVLWSARIARRKGAKNGLKSFTAMRALRQSAFDEAFYNQQLKGSEREGMDPVNHYVVFGAQEGLDPAPGFSTSFYLKAHDDLARVGINPFFHYLRHGARENRRVEPSSRLALFLEAHGHSAADAHRLGLSHTLLLGNGGSAGGDWPKKDRPADQAKFTLHDLRPNDDILDVAYMGKTFLEAHDLLGAKPRWEAAVAEINALPRPSISETPDISVIIPVYGQLAYTLNCLHSLLRQDANHSFEILVGDDASPDASEQWLRKIDNVRYMRHGENAGFIANCNATAQIARGKYLVFLNNDTRVADRWLDSMLETFWHFPKAGMVGSKLFYPDGSLQEAGGIVWRDGSAWNYGRNDDPNRPAYSYARAVDYVSGASFMIRRDLWKKLDGFDTRYSPAYYEDTDLAFRLRDLGHSVIMQPLSKVVHYEGKTSGTDTGSGAKAYQAVNKDKFLDRWRDTLKAHRDNGDKPHLERDRQVTKRVLIMDACNPTPQKDAGSKATVDLIRYYQALGYHVSFVPEDNFLFQRDEVGRLQAMGVECFYAPYERSVTDLLKTNGPLYDVVQVIRADVGFKNIELIRKLAPQARVIYLNADLHFLRMQRQALVENKPALLEEAEKMKAREMKLAAAVDVTIVHSDVERDILNDEVPDARVAVLPLIEDIVDADVPHDERRDLVFLGGYNHPPNVDAANFLLDEVWPKLSAKLPDAKLLLVGANPPEALQKRANDRVIVTGQVPELNPWFDRSRLFLAALRYGAGLKGKVLSAMAHGVPVIATDIAAEGLEVDNGKTIFLANSADEIVSKAVELYNQPAREWNRHSLHAQDYIQSHHSFQTAHDVLRRVLD